MKKSILELGKPLSISEQQQVKGGRYESGSTVCSGVFQGVHWAVKSDDGGYYHEEWSGGVYYKTYLSGNIEAQSMC
ncbi:hypothetical protein [Tenacibaculum caenipelagi]|uniref:Uncharacterized protein n=1 Tax=Tenacibaculum caenipelagi TaxID=1325435 RepID=A0A4R6TDV4_9FLAO|nr:hypothetical protein [Tenacibaculum caenipelagi]TDQ27668.1 hypothetical protein DFQ07_1519 [Tenacibaculum caenipelagi]